MKIAIFVSPTKSPAMKRLTLISIILPAILLFGSCGQTPQKRIVSETPIKTEVLGLKLCSVTSESKVEKALTKATDKTFLTTPEKTGTYTVVRAIPITFGGFDPFTYGGLSWHYSDVVMNDKMEIVEIRLIASYENVERAKEQFDAATAILSQKYGKGNTDDEMQVVFWTDDTNSVGLSYVESSAINGNDRSFCTMYYVNIALSEELEKQNTPDV